MELFKDCCKKGYSSFAKFLIKTLGTKPDGKMLMDALENEEFEIAKMLISTHVFDNCLSDNFIYYSSGGKLEIVKFLSSFPEVDVTKNNNQALTIALKNGYLSIVKFLLSLPGVNIDNIDCIVQAAYDGHLPIVKFLSSFLGIDNIVIVNRCIVAASCSGKLEVIKFLITLPGANLNFGYSSAIRYAVYYNKIEVVKFLSSFPEVRVENIISRPINVGGGIILNEEIGKFLASFVIFKRNVSKKYLRYTYLIDEIILSEINN